MLLHPRHAPVRYPTDPSTSRSAAFRVVALAATTIAVLLAASGTTFAATYVVNGTSPSCSNAGPGTDATPYCTISAAIAAHNGAGVTILVRPAVYHEGISIPASGAANNPFVLQGQPGVVIDATGLTYGIYASGRSWITIDGFTVTGNLYQAIRVGGGSNLTITHNAASGTNNAGIYCTNVSSMLLASNTVSSSGNHGIHLRDVSGSTIQDNVSANNSLNGINLTTDIGQSSGNLLQRNRIYGNGGPGLYFNAGSPNNLSVQNQIWGNEHGIQHSGAPGCRHIGDVIWGNLDDGISMKNGSTGTVICNCIIANNGLGHSAYDVYFDTTSTAGLVSDDNIVWNSNAQASVRFGNATYSNVTAYSSATGYDTRSFGFDPKLLDPAHGNFRLIEASPAIDCGNSGIVDWPALDAAGHARADYGGMSNLGLGPIAYAERGAFEFAPSGLPPVASLEAAPTSNPPALTFVLDASRSYDADGKILWYTFDFGDGTRIGPQAEPTATHTYTAGVWNATVSVVDTTGFVRSATSRFMAGATTAVGERGTNGLELAPVSPNPMPGSGRFRFSVPARSHVRLTVVDLQGRTVAVLADRTFEAGSHQMEWSGPKSRKSAGPQVYFLRLESSGTSIARRFVLER